MFFDLHSDILYDIVDKRLDHKHNILMDYHLPQLTEGGVIGGIWCYYTDINQELCDFEKALELITDELDHASDYINIVKTKNNFKTDKINVILGLESIAPVKDLAEFKKLYDYGFRHAMLTWNEENQFATGVSGSPNRGLSESGREIINFMINMKMIIDVSHANFRTASDILNITNKVIASHSNLFFLSPHPRNLAQVHVDAICQGGGLIGITAVKAFVNPQNPTIAEMAKHHEQLKALGYLDSGAFGFDFMDYLGVENLFDLHHAGELGKVIDIYRNHGFTEEEIAQITYKNALSFINSLL